MQPPLPPPSRAQFRHNWMEGNALQSPPRASPERKYLGVPSGTASDQGMQLQGWAALGAHLPLLEGWLIPVVLPGPPSPSHPGASHQFCSHQCCSLFLERNLCLQTYNPDSKAQRWPASTPLVPARDSFVQSRLEYFTTETLQDPYPKCLTIPRVNFSPNV